MTPPQLSATLFPISGLADQTFRMQVLRVLNPVPQDDLRPDRLQRWADFLWQELRVPVFPTGRYDNPAFVVPAAANLAPERKITINCVPDYDFQVEVTDTYLEISPAEAETSERQLAAKMLERVITLRLCELTAKYWRAQWNLFFRSVAENQGTTDEVLAFRGLHFSVVFLEGRMAHLAADLKTRYFGRRSLADYLPAERTERLGPHVDGEVNPEERALFVRDNGPMKRSCRFVSGTGVSIRDFIVPELQQTVLAYYEEKYPDLRLDPQDEAVFVRDHGNPHDLPVPASRLFPIFTVDDDELQQCSVVPQLAPAERVNLARSFLADLGPMRFADREFTVSDQLFHGNRNVFTAPALEFGGQHGLSVHDTGIHCEDEDETYIRWRNAKSTSLYEHGPYSGQPLPDVVFFYPDTLSRAQRETFLQRLTDEVRRLCRHPLNIIRQRAYSLGTHVRSGAGLLAEAEAVARSERGVILALVVLSEKFDGNVYALLKGQLTGLPSQCVAERTVQRIATDEAQPGDGSRLRNLALGVITAAGIQPWVLAESLDSEVYIGIDVLQNRVGYTFVYGICGRRVRVQFGEDLHRSKRHTAVGRHELRTRIESGVRMAQLSNSPVNSVVIHRGGRWWLSEEQGLQEAVAVLKRDGVLAQDCRICVLELRKSHLPVRLFGISAGNELQNPMPGSYLPLDDMRVILTTTGRPGAWDRQKCTASTLLVKFAKPTPGMDIVRMAHDVYRLTHLNWNAPEIEISLPVTLRWNDESLRSALLQPPEEIDSSSTEETGNLEQASA